MINSWWSRAVVSKDGSWTELVNKINNASRWIPFEGNGTHHIEVEFDAAYDISQIKFWTGWNGYNSELSNYVLDYWEGSAWINLVNENANNRAEVDVIFTSVKTNKIRLQSTDWIKLYEIEVY